MKQTEGLDLVHGSEMSLKRIAVGHRLQGVVDDTLGRRQVDVNGWVKERRLVAV